MNQSKITTRYAKALFKLAVEEKILDTIKKDIDLLNQVIKLDEFQKLLDSPIIPASQKIQTINQLFKDKVHPYTLQFLILLIENNREPLLNLIILDFYKYYREHLGIKEVELTTAIELDKELIDQFKQLLKKALQAEIELQHKIDPNIIGGFILRVEDKQLDLSVATQLKKLKKHITD